MLEIFAVKIPDKIDDLLLIALTSFVDPLKQERIKNFVHEADKLRTLFADLMIRSIIIRKTGLQNHTISFGENEYGKPYWYNGLENFHFNISHSLEWVVLAVDNLPVGIDIEGIHSIELSVSEHVFSPEEHLDLMSQPDKTAYFFTLWSLKESFIKMLGTGTTFPLKDFSVKQTHSHQFSISISGAPLEGVYLSQYNIDSHFKMGVCANHNNFPQHISKIPAITLIRNFIRVEGSLQKKRESASLPY